MKPSLVQTQEHRQECGSARSARLDATWDRFAQAVVLQGLVRAEQVLALRPSRRLGVMQWFFHRALPRGWRFASSMEAADCGVAWEADAGRIATPTQAQPGSREKLDILAQRMAEGRPLWHPADKVTRRHAAISRESIEFLEGVA